MTTYINADDGIVSGVAGLKYGADNSGSLVLQTNGTTAITISAAQVVTFTNAVNFNTAAFTNLSYTGTLTGGTGVVNLGSGQFYKDASGNIGIGQSNPADRLSIYQANLGFVSDGGGTNVVNFRNLSGTIIQQIQYSDADGSLNIGGTSGGAYPIKISTSGAERMRIDSSGRMLIGTTTGVGNELVSIRFNSSTSFPQGLNMVDANASASGAVFQVFRKSDDTYLGNIRRNSTDNAIYIGGNSYLALGSGDTERMRIDSTGNVGIGTATPRSRVSFGTSSVDTNGYDVSGLRLYDNGSTIIYGLGVSSTQLNYRAGLSSDQHVWYAGTTERMRIDSSGTVLVNTTSTGNVNGVAPKLAVSGNATFSIVQTQLFQQGVFIPDSGGTSGWAYLGRYATVQAGYICHIRAYIHVGFNSNNGQNAIVDVFFKTANAASSQAGSTGPFYGDGQYFKLGPNGINGVRVVQIDLNTYDIYMGIASYSNGSFYTIDTTPGSYWTNVGTFSTSAPSGNYITLTAQAITYT